MCRARVCFGFLCGWINGGGFRCGGYPDDRLDMSLFDRWRRRGLGSGIGLRWDLRELGGGDLGGGFLWGHGELCGDGREVCLDGEIAWGSGDIGIGR